jgi:spermidine synthase
MEHSGITHGVQFLDPWRRMEWTLYYAPTSGVGRLASSYSSRPMRMGVVGLGAGSLAAAGKGGDVVRFYELDADVERLAREHFTFLSGSAADVQVVLGDARLSMEREASQGYDVLVLDAFSGDGVPVHLLTREAMVTYLRHLKPDGVIAFHITNRHLDMAPVVAGLAREDRLDVVFVKDEHSTWALASRKPGSLDPVRAFASADAAPQRVRLWTDDYASLVPLLKWRKQR